MEQHTSLNQNFQCCRSFTIALYKGLPDHTVWICSSYKMAQVAWRRKTWKMYLSATVISLDPSYVPCTICVVGCAISWRVFNKQFSVPAPTGFVRPAFCGCWPKSAQSVRLSFKIPHAARRRVGVGVRVGSTWTTTTVSLNSNHGSRNGRVVCAVRQGWN